MAKRSTTSAKKPVQLDRLLHEAYLALLVVKSGIWRNKELNACGLVGAAVAVHSVEAAVKQIEDFIDGN